MCIELLRQFDTTIVHFKTYRAFYVTVAFLKVSRWCHYGHRMERLMISMKEEKANVNVEAIEG